MKEIVCSPENFVVEETGNEDYQRYAIERSISNERPPREVKNCFRHEGTHPNDEQNVEHGRTNNRANTDVIVGDEYANDGRK